MSISFPVLGMKNGDNRLYGIEKKDFGFVSKGHGKFYSELTFIDSNGKMYKIKSWSIKGRTGFWKTILNLQVLEELDFELEYLGVVTLEKIKKEVLDRIQKHPKIFAPLYNGTAWKERLEEFSSFKSLIMMFK